MIAIDDAHADLIYGLVCALKPDSVLELGYGEGRSCQAILCGLRANGNRDKARYVLVDDWTDWGGEHPQSDLPDGITLVEQSEREFTYSCTESFDFIFSDADHQQAEQWFIHTYTVLLKPGGVLCYHDVVNPDFPNLREIVNECERLSLRYVLFDRNSIAGERCDRGLLVIFKPRED